MKKRPYYFRGQSNFRKRTFGSLEAAIKAAELDLFAQVDGVADFVRESNEVSHIYVYWHDAQAARVALLPEKRTAVQKMGLFRYNPIK